MKYLVDWRMTLARDLLLTQNLPMTEIADRIGYSSPYAFAAAFRRQHGQPPGRWRPQRGSLVQANLDGLGRLAKVKLLHLGRKAAFVRRGQHQLAPISAKRSSCAPPQCVQCRHWTAAVGVGIPAPAGHLVPGGRAVGRLEAAATQQPPIGQLDPAHAVIAEHVAQGSGDGVEMERASSGQPRSRSQSGPSHSTQTQVSCPSR